MSAPRLIWNRWFSSVACALLVLAAAGAAAQDHSQHRPPPAKGQSGGQMSAEDHAAIGHDTPPQQEDKDHAAMGHGDSTEQQAEDHAAMGHGEPPKQQTEDHAAMAHDADQHAGHSAEPARPDLPREPIPPLTATDRAAAFPELHEGHATHDVAIQSFFQLDQLEGWDGDEGSGFSWEALGWAGGDVNRAWVRSEGERLAGETERADVELLYGRAISRWWDLVAGVQQDFSPGPSQTFAGIGVIGLSPYKFEIEATAYLGESGQTRASFEAEYELLLTNRLILQPLVEVDVYGKDDARRGIGAGFSTVEAGLRLRYEFTRRFAPYLGLVYERALSETADLRRAENEDIKDTVIVAGVRTWF